MPCRLTGLASERTATDRVLVTPWLATGSPSPPHQVCPPWHTTNYEEEVMFVIRIDPHRGSHAATVLDGDERVRAMLRLPADGEQRQRLLSWASEFTPRLWAVEGATGIGALLAQQLVAAGEKVLDVPPTLAARVRLLDNNHSDKTDSHDTRSPPSSPCATPSATGRTRADARRRHRPERDRAPHPGPAGLSSPSSPRCGANAEIPGHLSDGIARLPNDRHRPLTELRVVLPPLWHHVSS
jgi:Transposase